MIFKKGDEVIIDGSAKGKIIRITPSGLKGYDIVFLIKITKAGMIHNYENPELEHVAMGESWWCIDLQLELEVKLSDEADKAFRGIINDI